MTARRRNIYLACQVLVLSVALCLTVRSSREADWRSWQLVALLAVLAVVSERKQIEVHGLKVSASFIAIVVAMTLLGPAPAVAIGLAADLIAMVGNRRPVLYAVTNLTSSATFPLVGGLLCILLVGNVHQSGNPRIHDVGFAFAVFAVFFASNLVNFTVIAIHQRVMSDRPIIVSAREVLVPVLPGQFAMAVVAAILAAAYVAAGYSVLLGVIAILFIFQHLAVRLYESEERAEQLHKSVVRLNNMQLGMLTTLRETLNMRDPTTARHATAVASHARNLAREIGCSETEQEDAHTAGLLHDLGKFAWPDRVLHAHALTPGDVPLVRRHPQDGAALVGRLDGYGEIADVILYHHEKMDGTGYPAGLIGKEIPLLSRVIAICEAYDTMTARYSYETPRTAQEALDDLRLNAGTQFDPELVEPFATFLERNAERTVETATHAELLRERDYERRSHALTVPALSASKA